MKDWLRGPLKDMCYANIEGLIQINIIPDNKIIIQKLLNDHMEGKNDFSLRIWNLISLNLWLAEQN